MKYSLLLITVTLLSLRSAVAATYQINLVPEPWKFTPAQFYIAGIVDERSNRQTAGKALVGNDIVPAKFKVSLEDDLMKFINGSLKQDSTLVPLKLSFTKFEINESGTAMKHRATLSFTIKIFREIEGKRYQIYEAAGTPQIDMRGTYPAPHERNIGESLKSVLMNFNTWLNENKDLPPMAKGVRIVFDKLTDLPGNDTIIWSPGYRLKWSDFKGKNFNGRFMAQSNCVFTYFARPQMNEGILDLHITLNACFERKSSWVRKGSENDTLLRHEQLHFDICELNIRKIRQKMASLDINPMEYDIPFNRIFEEGWKDYQLQQQQYDDETEHGIDYDVQKRWEREIGAALDNN
jgi:hypothetical protein